MCRSNNANSIIDVYWRDPEGKTCGIKQVDMSKLGDVLNKNNYIGDRNDFVAVRQFILEDISDDFYIETVCGTQGYLSEFSPLIDPSEALKACPCCGSKYISAEPLNEYPGGIARRSLHCEGCGEEWAENFIFTGLGIDNVPCGLVQEIAKATKTHLENQKQPAQGVKTELPVYAVSEKAFKNSARRLNALLAEMGLDLGRAKTLQLLSQAIYTKPFEEIKATVLAENPGENTGTAKPKDVVYLVEAFGEAMLFVDGEFVTATYDGTDMEQPYAAIKAQAERESIRLGCQVIETDYNGSLVDWEYEELANAFLALGVIERNAPCMIREIESMKNGALIDGEFFVKYGLNDDWRSEFLDEDSGVDFGATIWMPEAHSADGNFYEWFVTAEQMLNAEKVNGVWHVKLDDQPNYTMKVEIL